MAEDKFDLIVDNLQKRGSMYLAPYTFDNLIHFLYGYHQAIVDFGHPEEGLKGMQELVTIKYGTTCALIWPLIIKIHFKKDDKEAIQLFFLFYDQLKQLRKTKGLHYLKDQYDSLPVMRKRKTNIYWPDKKEDTTNAK